GCPAHNARPAREVLNRMFSNRLDRSRWHRINWPVRSPHLTPLHFSFLRGTSKEKVYRDVPTTPENMRQRIIAACSTMNDDAYLHETIRQSVRARYREMHRTEGTAHVEHIL
ncbi:hypothetical protein WH47_07592, partial [Habropoda laboriosa]